MHTIQYGLARGQIRKTEAGGMVTFTVTVDHMNVAKLMYDAHSVISGLRAREAAAARGNGQQGSASRR